MYSKSIFGRGELALSRSISRSARRHTVRATWQCAAIIEPPGRMNDFMGGVLASSVSMICSICAMASGVNP